MNCNRITKPKFTREQIIECQICKHISGKKIWCCLFGVQIIEQGKILVPKKKIEYPSVTKMGGNFVRAASRHIASGLKKRTEAEQAACQAICKECDDYVKDTKIGPRCKSCGCCMSLKRRWATSHCLKGKW